MTSPLPSAAIKASSPTSRATFRHVIGCVGATNREADSLRHGLLARWDEHAGAHELGQRLRRLDKLDPQGEQGAEARIIIWFSFGDEAEDEPLPEEDPLLAALSPELRARLIAVLHPPEG